jgi:bla regulator protein blaR1
MRYLLYAALIPIACSGLSARAQDQPAPSGPAQFEVVSIKRNTTVGSGGGMRSLTDGTTIITNQPIRSIILAASPVPAREVEGLPDWVTSERYDITLKPPAGAAREQRGEMMRNMFAERMKLEAHVEERERDVFALVLARSDGRLGPQLKPSALDCSPRPAGAAPPAPPSFDPKDAKGRCGGMFGQGVIVSGGITMDSLVLSLSGLAGRQVNNRTGLQGWYALTLRFASTRTAGAPPDSVANVTGANDDVPDFFTAIQEQLGLKLQSERSKLPILVVDHIERPTEN